MCELLFASPPTFALVLLMLVCKHVLLWSLHCYAIHHHLTAKQTDYFLANAVTQNYISAIIFLKWKTGQSFFQKELEVINEGEMDLDNEPDTINDVPNNSINSRNPFIASDENVRRVTHRMAPPAMSLAKLHKRRRLSIFFILTERET